MRHSTKTPHRLRFRPSDLALKNDLSKSPLHSDQCLIAPVEQRVPMQFTRCVLEKTAVLGLEASPRLSLKREGRSEVADSDFRSPGLTRIFMTREHQGSSVDSAKQLAVHTLGLLA